MGLKDGRSNQKKKERYKLEMWFHRRLLNITYKDRKTNESVLKDLGTQRELFGQVVKRKLTYFGHMSRKNNLNLTKSIVQGKPCGKKGQGRPRMAYMDNVRQWTGLSAHAAFQAALNREGWRKVTRKAVRAANALMDDAG